MTSAPIPVVVDTNTFVAAAFNKRSASARIFEAIREGRLTLVWNEATRAETRTVVRKIPPIHWEDFADLFESRNEFKGATEENAFGHVPDQTDRKFAALATAAGATLITQDAHLLDSRDDGAARVMRPGEFLAQWNGDGER